MSTRAPINVLSGLALSLGILAAASSASACDVSGMFPPSPGERPYGAEMRRRERLSAALDEISRRTDRP